MNGVSLSESSRPRALRVIVVRDGTATAEDVDLDAAQATALFGSGVAAQIFDDQRPGVPDLTYRTAALRYGAPVAALIFPAGASTKALAINGVGDDQPHSLPLANRDAS